MIAPRPATLKTLHRGDMMTRKKASAVVAVALAAAGIAVSAHIATAGPGDPAQTREQITLESVPGFGMSPDTVLRDDMIAYWEAWRRDTKTAECMQAAGFAWQPEALYPREVVEMIATELVVRPSAVKRELPEQANARAAQALSSSDLERYDRALYGESAADMAALSATGRAPAGRDGARFGRGGCVGLAEAAVGSVWDLPRAVETEITAQEIAIKDSPAFAEVRAEYASCAAQQGLAHVDGPEDLDQLLVSADASGDPAALDEAVQSTDAVDGECQQIWARGSAEARAHAASLVRAAHARQFNAHERRYAHVIEQINEDEQFKEFVAVALSTDATDSAGVVDD